MLRNADMRVIDKAIERAIQPPVAATSRARVRKARMRAC